MSAKNGLVFSPRPFEVYDALHAFRLQKALPCLEGPLVLEDLKNERIMKSVYSTVISVMDRKIVLDECHFGIVDHPQFHVFALIVTQKKMELKELSTFEYKNREIITEKMLDIIDSYTTVVHLVQSEIHVCETVEFLEMDPYEMFPLNEPLKEQPLVGFDVVEYREVEDFFISDVCSSLVTKATVLGQKYTYVQTPLARHYSLENLGCNVERGEYRLTVQGGYFLVPDQAGIIVRRDVVMGDDVENNYPYTVYAESEMVSVMMKIHFTIRVHSRFRKVAVMNLFDKRYTVKVRKMFTWLLVEMKKLPYTLLVKHNLDTLKSCIIGLRMPSRELVCQCILMVGAEWMLPAGYIKMLEKWRFYHKYENWAPLVQRSFAERRVLRNVLSIFDSCRFDYRGDMNRYYSEEIAPYPREYDGFMKYVDYIEHCRVMCSNSDDLDEQGKSQRSLVLLREVLEVDCGIEAYPLLEAIREFRVPEENDWPDFFEPSDDENNITEEQQRQINELYEEAAQYSDDDYTDNAESERHRRDDIL